MRQRNENQQGDDAGDNSQRGGLRPAQPESGAEAFSDQDLFDPEDRKPLIGNNYQGGTSPRHRQLAWDFLGGKLFGEVEAAFRKFNYSIERIVPLEGALVLDFERAPDENRTLQCEHVSIDVEWDEQPLDSLSVLFFVELSPIRAKCGESEMLKTRLDDIPNDEMHVSRHIEGFGAEANILFSSLPETEFVQKIKTLLTLVDRD